MSDYLDSSHPSIIQTPRVFPRGCGPDVPMSPSALQLFYRTQPHFLTSNPPRSLVFALPASNSSPSNPQSKPKSAQFHPQTLNRTQRPSNSVIVIADITDTRKKLLNLLDIFKKRCKDQTTTAIHRIDLKVYADLKIEEPSFLESRRLQAMRVGAVPGVEVEDRFYYRAELMIAGLHRRLQNGIDLGEYRGRKVATCVVANEGSYDRLDDPDMVVYRGEGGHGVKGGEVMGKSSDQEMIKGNLAMKVSMEMGVEVRVVRGVKVDGGKKTVYVYDGLYEVVRVKEKRSDGCLVFDFEMRRKTGQKRINWRSHYWC